MTDAVLHDRVGDDELVRTVTFDVPADALIGGLLSCEAYLSHQRYTAGSEVALLTDDGYAVASIVPTDGVAPEDRTFDDWFSGGPDREHDKAQATFRDDLHDVDAVLPVIREVATDIRGEDDGD